RDPPPPFRGGRARRGPAGARAGAPSRIHPPDSGRSGPDVAGDRGGRPWPRRPRGVGCREALRLAPAAPGGRDVGLRARGPDAADGVHVDGVRRAAAPHLRRVLPADRRREHRLPSGLTLLRALHLVSLGDPAVVRTLSLRARDRTHAALVGARARPAVGLGARLSRLPGSRARAPPGLAGRDGAVMRPWLLGSVQAVVALVLAPGLAGALRWMKARLQSREGSPPWQPYLELRKLFAKEVVVSSNASWLFRAV